MENKTYKIHFKNSNSKNPYKTFHKSIRENHVGLFYEEYLDKETFSYLINSCSLIVEETIDNIRPEATIKIFHENSLEKIIETKKIIEEKTGSKLEESKK